MANYSDKLITQSINRKYLQSHTRQDVKADF